MTKPNGWSITRDSEMVATLRLEKFASMADERWVLLQSDEHADNAHSDLPLIQQHMAEAVERDAAVLKFGDTYCAMQGRWDKRADPRQLREELRGANYLDELVNFHDRLYRPYAHIIAGIGYGNHETSIQGHHQTDLVERLVDRLRQAGSPVQKLGYTGFVRILAQYGNTVRTILLHFHHGSGGGGEVTRGMIDWSRTRGMYMADVYYAGHIHRRNQDENVITTVSAKGICERRNQLFLRGSCYKDEDGEGGWHVERGRAARAKGGWWLKITPVERRNQNALDFEVRAVAA